MEILIAFPARCEVRAVIRFLHARKLQPLEIHQHLVEVYGKECMSIQHVRRWCRAFAEGRTDVHDGERSGRPPVSNAIVEKINSALLKDPRVSVRELVKRIPVVSHGTIARTLKKTLGYHKVSASSKSLTASSGWQKTSSQQNEQDSTDTIEKISSDHVACNGSRIGNDLPEESTDDNDDTKRVDPLFEETLIKTEEIDIDDHGVQYEDYVEITSPQIVVKSEAADSCSEEIFSRPSDLNRVISGKPFKCQHCNSCFTTSDNLNQHLRLHTGESRAHNCEFCGKVFSRDSLLKTHVRRHTNERPFKCVYCNTGFTKAYNMNQHMRLHTGETVAKPYKCEVCTKAFDRRSNLENHLRIHTREKPFKCQYCDGKFGEASNLNRHIIRMHSEKVITYTVLEQDNEGPR